MNLLKSVLCTGVLGAGLGLATPQEAEAQSFYLGIGTSSRNYTGWGGYGGYGRLGGIGVYPGYGGIHGHRFPGRAVWHDTSHYDYYPGRYVPHGNHYDYIPGHYHFHRDGHWDSVGGWGGHHHHHH